MRASSTLSMIFVIPLLIACQPQLTEIDATLDSTPTHSDPTLSESPTSTIDWQTATYIARETHSESVSATQTAAAPIHATLMAQASLTPRTPVMLPPPNPRSIDQVARVADIIAYFAAGNLCLLHGDAPAIYLTKRQEEQGSATISPDGELVVFTIIRNSTATHPVDGYNLEYAEIWVMPTTGGEPRLLTTTEQFKIAYPHLQGEPDRWEWIGNTHKVAFTSVHPPYRTFGYTDVHLVDADTGEYSLLIPPAPNDESIKDWGGPLYASPDGRYIAYLTDVSLNLIGIDGQNASPNILIYDHVNTYSEFAVYAQPTWSSDSSGMWVTVPSAEGETTTELYYVSISGEVRPIAVLPSHQRYARISPDGKLVAFVDDTFKLLRLPNLEEVANLTQFTSTHDIVLLEWIDTTQFQFYNRTNSYPDFTYQFYSISSDGSLIPQETIIPKTFPACTD